MDRLNYHHLRYFHAVATEGGLTAAARALNVSQSAVSAQLAALEDRLGHPLFDRVGRRMELTEAGRVALAHAERAFAAGRALVAELAHGRDAGAPLRVGAPATLSRNVQIRFLAPAVAAGTPLVLRSDNPGALRGALERLELDVVLATEVPEGGALRAHPLGRQAVGLHGRPDLVDAPDLAALFARAGLIVPAEGGLRARIAAVAERLGARARVVAEVDDMAMARLLAREGAGVALVPAVVVADELAAGRLATAPFETGLEMAHHALVPERRLAHPVLAALLDDAASRLAEGGG